MIDADPVTIAAIAQDTGQTLLQAGPPDGLPEQVPGFVSEILAEVGGAAGDLGQTISELTPGGGKGATEAAEQAGTK